MYNVETMCVEESSNVVFDEVKVMKEVEINYDDEIEEMVVKIPTPCKTSEVSSKKELVFY